LKPGIIADPAGAAPTVQIGIEIPGVTLGVITVENVKVAPTTPELFAEMDAVCERLRGELTIAGVAELESIGAVRRMFRAWGVDPARYRPSSEALLRRVVQGKGLYRVSNVVDIINLGSIETGWPYGTYDTAQVTPPVVLRMGAAGEAYEGIGRHVWHLEGRPVLADAQGPFGSPVSDSIRTMITEATRTVLTVIFAPSGSSQPAIEQALNRVGDRLARFAGGRVASTEMIQR